MSVVCKAEDTRHHRHATPGLDPMRSHPRYHALLRKMNLNPGKEE
jgi:hypothetical protein